MADISKFKFSKQSIKRLKGVHEDLIFVLILAMQETEMDFGIAEGRRTLARQQRLKDEGKSQILKSRHLTGHAVDIFAYADGKALWDKKSIKKVWNAIKATADVLGVDVKWGGNWRGFPDAPHIELSKEKYPA